MPHMSNNKNFTECERILFDLLEDELSQKIFIARNLWASTYGKDKLTNDFITQVSNELFINLVSLPDYLTVDQFLGIEQMIRTHKFVLWGYGQTGKLVERYCADNGLEKNMIEIWDTGVDEPFETICGITVKNPKVYTAADLPQFDFLLVGVVSGKYAKSIVHVLKEYEIASSKIRFIDWQDNLNCYFDSDIILPRLCENEVFVDGGCYDADTSLRLLSLNPDTKLIVAFEPDKQNFSRIQCTIAKLRDSSNLNVDFIIRNEALYISNGQVSFWETNNGTSSIAAESNNIVPAICLDSVISHNVDVTFIKLDIEGSELSALRGALGVITRCKPKLAISVYHKPYDYIDVLEYIHSIVPEYKFYLRQYGVRNYETVLYCIL